MKTNLIAAVVAVSIASQALLIGQEWPTSDPATNVVTVKRAGGDVTVRHGLDVLEVATPDGNRRVLLDVLFDPETGYYWWFSQISHQKGTPTTAFANEWGKSFWIIPEVGIVRVAPNPGGIHVEISNKKATNFEEALTAARADSDESRKRSGQITRAKEMAVGLSQIIGHDFFFKKGDAALPPRAKIITLTFTSGTWHVELQSALTQERAIVDLDSDLKVLRATRNGQSVYPKN
jgi:hypothetical protein